ncbi:hypothetical protein E0494_08725 [Marinilabiliaceae bacterium JC040]|nr:hypothetical protein [Marinilabiliaceae bacterium JC040]
MRKAICLTILLTTILFSSCKLRSVSYTMTGGTIPAEAKTFSVDFFQNKAPIVVPYLSSYFTEELKNKLRDQTSLDEITDMGGDLTFEGQIVGYDLKPVDIQRNETAARTRLTITVRVKYTNPYNKKDSFDTTFSHYIDFSNERSLDSYEEQLIKDITKVILEKIYNKAFVNW